MQAKSIVLGALTFVSAFCTLQQARATVVVQNVTGASMPYVAPNQQTSPGATPAPTNGTTTIYAGTAGAQVFTASGTVQLPNPNPSAPFDTCKFQGTTPTGLSAPLHRLYACNHSAIDGSVILNITYKADKPGYAFLLDTTNNVTIMPNQPVFVAQGTVATVSFTWGQICQRIANSATSSGTGGIDQTNCFVPTSNLGNVTHTLQLGVTAVQGGATTSDDTAATLNFIFSTYVGQGPDGGSVAEPCETTGSSGLCHFAIHNGDGKVVLGNLQNGLNFPTGGPLNFANVILLWGPALDADPQLSNNQTPFSSINAATPTYQPLAVTIAADNTVSLAPSRVLGFTNDKWYEFKVAVQDLAGNIGYYTADDADEYCAHAPNPTSLNCHVGHPGQVVGVLSKPIQCYIATAAYGSPMAPQVETFRQFRDQFLMPLKWGAHFVNFYYEHSPKYARIIANNEALRTLARLSLWPALAFAWLSLHLGLEAAIVITLASLFVTALGLILIIRAARQYRRRTKCPAAV